MRKLILLFAIGYLALARADDLTDHEINEELLLDEQSGLPHQSKDRFGNNFAASVENEPMELNEDFVTNDARPGWGRVVRRVVRTGRRVGRRIVRTGRRVVRRVVRTGRRVGRRIVRTGRRVVRRVVRTGRRIFRRFFQSCRMSKYYKRGNHVGAGKASASCILETNPRKQAACWAPKIYYAIGEQYRASSVEYFLPHVEMRSNSNRLLQRHCTARNLKAVKHAYLTTRTPLHSATSTLPFFKGQHPKHSPIYTFYRTFKRGTDVYRDFFYWAFFPYNLGKHVCIGGAVGGRCIGKCRWFGHHVGDWEHVTIRLKNNLPLAMYISAHNFGGKYNYDNYRGAFRKGATVGQPSAAVGKPVNLAYGRPTKQSSTGWNGFSQRAVDGRRNGNYGSGSCTHTNWNHYPWWRVDLGAPQRVFVVSLSNRGDCCSNRLKRIEISVGNTDRSGANTRCYYHGGALGRHQTATFACYRPLVGRYVYVRLHGWNYLTLCEVEVYGSGGNLAYGRRTKQSSTGWNGFPQRAVDGRRNGNYGSGSCTHTNWNHYPWWRVDLGIPQRVFMVSLSNRGDCCSNRLKRIEINVGNTDRSGANPRCYYHGGALGRHQTSIFNCYRPLVGRYVYVRLHGWNYLTLCEVEVYGPSEPKPISSGNIALRRPTKQESTRHGGHASRGVDGNTGTCAHSYSRYRPWWRVDLGHQRYVYKVTITNTRGASWPQLGNFDVRVGAIDSPDGANFLCAHQKGSFGWGTKSLSCSSPGLGRYVYVRKLTPGSLILCEVKVYAVLRGYSPLLTGNIAYRKGTRQISTGWGGHASRAVDGNRHGNYNHHSCTHTHRHVNPWWRVDIGSPQEIAKVSISNRADCCWSRLRRIEIRAGNHPSSVHGSSLCTYYPGALSKWETRSFTCSKSVIGRYVYVRILAHEWLTLCEVQVYAYKPGNLAYGRPTKQSSTGWNGFSQRAVDGRRNGNYGSGSCTHTTWNHYPWWRVDLGAPQRVFKVSLSNRGDCCSNRLKRIEISVGNTDRSGANPRCYYHGGALGRHQTAAFTCYRPLVGRYVYVRLHGWNYLTLCEVEVYGTIGGQADVKMDNGHPVVFTAKGSHGMWTRQGIHTYKTLFNKEKLQDQASAGLAWETWRNMVYIKYQKNTKKNPYRGNLSWLNFDGAWGNKERACISVNLKLRLFGRNLLKKNEKQCTLEGGPGSLNSRGAMVNHFPLN